MELEIQKLINEGFGLARKDGKAIFVKKTVPGDTIEAKIVKEKKNFAEAIIVKIKKPSPHRIDPECPYFALCGGCEHQNISYENQLEYKEGIFTEILDRQKIKTKILPLVPGSTSPFFYRNSIRFFFQDAVEGIGFARHNYLYEEGFVKVKSCLLQSKISNQILEALKNYINDHKEGKKTYWQLKIREGKYTQESMIEIITSSHDLPGKEGIVNCLKQFKEVKSIYHTIAPNKSLKHLERRLIYGSPVIHEKIGKYRFQISPESFFQTNSLGVQTLYDKIKEFAQVKPKDKILDLYSGTGSIGIYLSTLAKRVVGIESVQEAVNDAFGNAKMNHVQNCEFICADVSKWLDQNKTNFDVIVIDPPRAGLEKEVIKKIAKLNFEKMIYTSCNPATFARDIKLFELENIFLEKVQPIDMFPQTHHIECVGILKKV